MQSASKREMCYQARDDYFTCLDKKEADASLECTEAQKVFESGCPPSWVSYFEKHRLKQQTLQYQIDAVMTQKGKN